MMPSINGISMQAVSDTPFIFIEGDSWRAKGPGYETVRNQWTYTNSLDHAPWSPFNATISANAVANPVNGAVDADALVEGTDLAGLHWVSRNDYTFVATNPYTISVYAKKAGHDWVFLEVGGAVNRWFNVATGAVGSGNSSTGSMVDVGGGWYRVIMAFNAVFSGATPCYITTAEADGTDVIAVGLGAASYYAWGTQLDVGSLTDYQPILATTPPLATVSTPIYLAVADGSTGTPDDTTYAFTQTAGSTCKLYLTQLPDPFAFTGHTLKVRGYADEGEAVEVGLYCGETRNLLTYTEALDVSTPWQYRSCTITANATVAPDGTTTADKVVEDNTTDFHTAYATGVNANFSDNQTMTFSVHIKGAERTFGRINFYDKGGDVNYAFLNLTTGVIGDTGGLGYISSAVVSAGSGWWRLSVTASTRTGGNDLFFGFPPSTGSTAGSETYLGDGSSGIYVWGMQLELGSLSAYQPILATSPPDTLIATTTQILTGTPTTYSTDISYAQANAISNYHDLRVWLTGREAGSPSPATFEVRITWIEFKTPSGTAVLYSDALNFGAAA